MSLFRKIFQDRISQKITFSVIKDTSNKEYTDKLIEKLVLEINEFSKKKIAFSKWFDKNRSSPYITVSPVCQIPISGQKSIHLDINIWSGNKKERDLVSEITFRKLKLLLPMQEIRSVEIQEPKIIDLQEDQGIFSKLIEISFTINYKLNDQETENLRLEEKRLELQHTCEQITGHLASEFIVSNSKRYILAYRICGEKVDLIEKNKAKWHKILPKVNCAAISSKEDFIIFSCYLTEKEMGGEFKVGGHALCFDLSGNVIFDFKTSSVAMSCAISPDNSFVVIGTINPNCKVYCLNTKGEVIWDYKAKKVVMHLEVNMAGNIIVYTGKCQADKEKLVTLNKQGETIS